MPAKVPGTCALLLLLLFYYSAIITGYIVGFLSSVFTWFAWSSPRYPELYTELPRVRMHGAVTESARICLGVGISSTWDACSYYLLLGWANAIVCITSSPVILQYGMKTAILVVIGLGLRCLDLNNTVRMASGKDDNFPFTCVTRSSRANGPDYAVHSWQSTVGKHWEEAVMPSFVGSSSGPVQNIAPSYYM